MGANADLQVEGPTSGPEVAADEYRNRSRWKVAVRLSALLVSGLALLVVVGVVLSVAVVRLLDPEAEDCGWVTGSGSAELSRAAENAASALQGSAASSGCSMGALSQTVRPSMQIKTDDAAAAALNDAGWKSTDDRHIYCWPGTEPISASIFAAQRTVDVSLRSERGVPCGKRPD